MDAAKYLKMFGTKKAEEVAVAAKTSLPYFQQLAYKVRRPSPDLARRLVDASDGVLSFEELLVPRDQLKG